MSLDIFSLLFFFEAREFPFSTVFHWTNCWKLCFLPCFTAANTRNNDRLQLFAIWNGYKWNNKQIFESTPSLMIHYKWIARQLNENKENHVTDASIEAHMKQHTFHQFHSSTDEASTANWNVRFTNLRTFFSQFKRKRTRTQALKCNSRIFVSEHQWKK